MFNFVFSLFLVQKCFPCCIPVMVVIHTTNWAEDISWETEPHSEAFFLGVYEDNSVYQHEYCLPPQTTYTFVANGSYGDGWNGGINKK